MLEFSKENRFVEVIVPLPLEGCFTYSIPDTIEQIPKPGCRVEIEFGKRRHYSAIVRRTVNSPVVKNIKPIIQVLDQEPIVTENQLEFWDWMSRYYMASIGDVMNTALISAFKLESNTTILRTDKAYDLHELTDYEYLILEALDIKNQLSILDIQSILQRKTILPIIKKLIELDLIVTREELNEQESAVKVKWIRISPTLLADPIALNKTMTELESSEKKNPPFIILFESL